MAAQYQCHRHSGDHGLAAVADKKANAPESLMIAALAKFIDWSAIQAYQTAIDECCPVQVRIQRLPLCPVTRTPTFRDFSVPWPALKPG